MSTEDSRDETERYLERIERQFGLRRGGRLLLSPRDWRLVHEWHERGIPLPVVLRGINHAFDLFAASPRRDRINSLAYCAQQVEEAWEQERELAAADGTRSASPEDSLATPIEHLRRSAAACSELSGARDEAQARILAAAARELGELADGLASGEIGARDADARAEAIEKRVRAADASLFADEATSLPDPGKLRPFSPWTA